MIKKMKLVIIAIAMAAVCALQIQTHLELASGLKNINLRALDKTNRAEKEKSESKLCKIARYLKTTPKRVLHETIKSNRINRPSTMKACLESGNLGRDFN